MNLNLETKEILRKLGLVDVPGDWVSVVWEESFCETVTLPIQVEEAVLSEMGWRRAVATCRRWVGAGPTQQGEEDVPSTGFWTTLLDGGLSHKSLLALLYCLLERNKQQVTDKLCAIHAAQLYFVLLQIPGSGAFKIFHPMIFQKALDVFYLFPDRDFIHRRRSSARSTSGEGVRRGRGRRGKRKRQESELEDDSSVLGESVEGGSVLEEGVQAGGEEEVKRLLKNLIKDLLCLLQTLALADQEVVKCQVVQVMVRMTRCQLTSAPAALSLGRSTAADTPLCVYAWNCLQSLCRPLHGGLEGTTTEVFRQLLPSLLMLTADGGVHTSSSLPHFLTIVSQHTLDFVRYLWEQHGEVVVTPLKALVQHLCIKIPDRAEYRNKLAAVVRKLLCHLSDQVYSQLLDWIYKYSRNTKVGFRVFALDIVSELLTETLRQPPAGALSGEEEYRLSYKFLLKMMLSRCSDKAPTVRGRALTCLAAAAGSERLEVREAVKRTIQAQTATDPLLQTPRAGPPEGVIMSMIHRRATDEKVGVRKAALQALEAIIRMDLNNIKKEDVSVIHERCLDPALSVRKQALSSLNALTLERMQCSMLHSLWLDGVLPMVMDRESGAQEKCMSLLEEVLLKNIVPLDRSTSESHVFVWHLLSLIASEERLDLRRYLWRALEFWAKQGRLSPSLVKAVCSHTSSKEHLQAAWMLLAELSQFTTGSIEAKFLMDSWNQYSSSVSMSTSSPLVQILVVVGNLARNLSKVAMQDIKDQIVCLLSTFKLSPAVIQAAVNTLCQICSAVNPPKGYQPSLDSWCVPLLRSSEQYLSSVLLKTSDSATPAQFNETEAICYLFTLGEITQLCPAHTSHHLCRMVQSMLLATSEQEEDSQRSSSQDSRLTGLSELSLTPTLRAHTYITLGKLCLQHEDLAKTSILQMVRELETSQHAAVRNNIIVVLCDLAVRYSTKVDPYISNISACLRDPSLLVRRQALTLLARLLQEDYVKWRGSLFFRFVSTLVDDQMRRFGEFCLVHLLLSRQPAVFFQHFVECVFHFNCYEKHRVYNKFRQSEREKQLFSLRGSNNAGKRLAIYTFLLSHMADEHRFQLTAKLCQEVLGGVVDGALPLEEDTSAVVRDTLAVLTSKEIKLSSLRRNVGEELADEGDHVGAAVATAQTKIISQIVKRNVIENIVPIVISAKHLFERERSPLLKDLLLYLKELMQDYRNEISEILAADPQLAEEIEFDLKRFAEEQKRTARGQQTPLVTTPHAQMISPLLSPGVLGSPAAGGSVFTPPRLRKEGGGATTPTRNTTIVPKATPALKTRVPLPLGISPLVVVRRVRPPKKTPPLAPPTSSQAAEGVSSLEAARTRADMINSEYAANITTPVVPLKTPHIPLQRAVLLSTARRAGLPQKPHPPPPPRTPASRHPAPEDETILHIPGRAASTPEGLAESISFNVGSLVPPSPIPANTTVDCYSTRSRTRSQARNKKKAAREPERDGKGDERKQPGADIMMVSPDAEPRRLAKWKITVK